MRYCLDIRRSSNGRTAGSGPANRGSNPCLRTSKISANYSGYFYNCTWEQNVDN